MYFVQTAQQIGILSLPIGVYHSFFLEVNSIMKF